MPKKRPLIRLENLARESAPQLESMVTELAGDVRREAKYLKPGHWSERFVASGKGDFAPKVRQP